MRTGDDHRAVTSAINVTPMVDVMLVLLVVFMVTAPLMRSAIGVRLPRASGSPASLPRRAIHLTLDGTGAIRVGDAPGEGGVVVESGVVAEVEARRQACGGCPVVLSADGAAAYQAVAGLLGNLQAAGVQGVSLAVRPATAAPVGEP